jgi:hypothetical protein
MSTNSSPWQGSGSEHALRLNTSISACLAMAVLGVWAYRHMKYTPHANQAANSKVRSQLESQACLSRVSRRFCKSCMCRSSANLIEIDVPKRCSIISKQNSCLHTSVHTHWNLLQRL